MSRVENNQQIRILEIVGNAKLGGVVNCVLNYYRNIDRTKFVLDFVTYGPSAADSEIQRLGGKVYYVPNFIKFPQAIAALRKILSANQYDIVHSHLTSLSVFALYAAKKQGVPVRICHSHSTSGNKGDHAAVKKLLRKFSTRYSNVNLACGIKAGKWLYGKKPFTVVHNAVELDRFVVDRRQGLDIRQQYGIDGSTKVVGFCGRFCNQKNLFFLLKSFALVKRKDVVLLMVGDGELRTELNSYANKLGIADKVIMTGAVSNSVPYYNAMDLFVLPSLYEGLPLVAIEAQACGLTCLFSDRVTREADVTHNNSFLPLKTKVWAQAICNALDNNVTQDDTHDKLQELYGIQSQAKMLETIYLDSYNKHCK